MPKPSPNSEELPWISLPQDTAYQNAVQALTDCIETLSDSTASNAGTFSGLLTDIETAAANFDTVLSTGIYAERKARLSADKLALVAQINLEQNNISTIVTYSNTLVDTTNYSSLAGNANANALLVRASQNASWRGYFENYATNLSYDNPLYDAFDDSATQALTDGVLTTRGLPDVTAGASWAEFFATQANVGVTDGALCGEAGIGHVRLMLSTPSHILETIIIAMATALREAQ